MRSIGISTLLIATLTLWGCGATTHQAEKSMQASFIGKPSDAFFAKYGAPMSAFKLNDGGTLYRWRGGESTVNIPAQYRTIAPVAPAMGTETGRSTTTTSVSQPNANTTVSRSTTRSFSVGMGVGVPLAQQILVSPARTEQLFCEAEITVNAQGLITHVHALQDTHGEAFSQSRCAEVFNVK